MLQTNPPQDDEMIPSVRYGFVYKQRNDDADKRHQKKNNGQCAFHYVLLDVQLSHAPSWQLSILFSGAPFCAPTSDRLA